MESIIDYRGKTPEKTTAGIPLITAKVIKGGRIETPSEFIAADAYEEWMRRGIPEAGDVVITTEAPLGEVAQLPKGKVALAQRVITLSGKKGLVDNTFLKYLLLSRPFQEDLEARATGTTVVGIKQSVLRKIDLAFPSFLDQKAIAHILGTLDDKIELNHKTNETLEAMAKALFKSWFVDFDPVRAKAEGRPTGLPAEISNLFPDSFEDSELGEIPRAWGVAKIDQIFKIQKGSIDPSVTPDETFDHYSIPAFDSGKNPAKELGSSIKSQKFLVGDDDLLISKLNPSTPRVWIPFSSSARRSICSTEFLVCRASTDVGRAFAYCLASSDSIIEVMTGLAGGTSNSHQRIRPSDFLSLDCCIGSQKVRSAFSDVVEPLLRKTLAQRIESRSLAYARDALLPKLISGELRIPDAEKMLEEVGV